MPSNSALLSAAYLRSTLRTARQNADVRPLFVDASWLRLAVVLASACTFVACTSTEKAPKTARNCQAADRLMNARASDLTEADRSKILFGDWICVAIQIAANNFPTQLREERLAIARRSDATKLNAALDEMDADAVQLVSELRQFQISPYRGSQYSGLLGRLDHSRSKVLEYGKMLGPFAFPGPLNDWHLRYLQELLEDVVRTQGAILDRPAATVLK